MAATGPQANAQVVPTTLPLGSVLVATDFSRRARQALDRALLLPLARGARITLLHVLPPRLPRDARAQIKQAARASLDAERARAQEAAASAGATVRFSSLLGRGKPFVEIIRRARAAGADLIVLGRKERPSGLQRLLPGRTAEPVVRKGDIPVLLVASAARKPYRSVIAAIDLTDTSREIAELALRVFGARLGQLWVMHAFQIAFESSLEGYLAEEQLTRYRLEARQGAHLGVRKVVESLDVPPGLSVAAVVRKGEPRERILEEVERRQAELVVMGTHARSGLSHALLGSVAESILRTCPCDVLIARPARFTFELP